jgi:hypothetical protein
MAGTPGHAEKRTRRVLFAVGHLQKRNRVAFDEMLDLGAPMIDCSARLSARQARQRISLRRPSSSVWFTG